MERTCEKMNAWKQGIISLSCQNLRDYMEIGWVELKPNRKEHKVMTFILSRASIFNAQKGFFRT